MANVKLTKEEAERAIRALYPVWARARGLSMDGAGPSFRYNFADFKDWLSARGYSHFLDFASNTGPERDVQMWFDDEFKQRQRK